MNLARLAAPALSLIVAACAATASQFPVAQQTLPADASASCETLGAELERLAVLRREIGRERRELNAQDAASVVINTLLFPPLLLIDGPLTAAGASARNQRLDASSDAAETRMITLLQLRAQRECEADTARAEAETTLASALQANPGDAREARRARAQAVDSYLTAVAP